MSSTTDKDQLAAEAYAALEANDGNATAAAKALDLPRTTFRALIVRHEATLAQAEADPVADAPEADEFDASRAEYDTQTEAAAIAQSEQAVAEDWQVVGNGIDWGQQAEAAQAAADQAAEPEFTHVPADRRNVPGVQYDLVDGQVMERVPAGQEPKTTAKRRTSKPRQPKPAPATREDGSVVPPQTRPCACQCGQQVTRTFARGHDAALLKKLRAGYAAGHVDRAGTLAIAASISDRFLGKVTKSLARIDAGSGGTSAYVPAEKTNECRCGCGELSSRTFARGHDSRLAKQLRAAYVAGDMDRGAVLHEAGKVSDRFHGKLIKSLTRADEQAAAAKAKADAKQDAAA